MHLDSNAPGDPLCGRADDLGATTAAFAIGSLWWAEALAGRLDEAIDVFHRVIRVAMSGALLDVGAGRVRAGI